MSRQRMRAIRREIDKIITRPYPSTPGGRIRELIELDNLVEELGLLMLRRFEEKQQLSSADLAMYYYLSGRVRQ